MSDESFGVLVGWTHQMVNGRLVLSLESVHSLEQSKSADIDRQHLHMTLNQALVLGNFLLSKSGQMPPVHRQRSKLTRWLGL